MPADGRYQDETSFEDVIGDLARGASSRRETIRRLVGAVFGLGGLTLFDTATAGKRRNTCRKIKDKKRRKTCKRKAKAPNDQSPTPTPTPPRGGVPRCWRRGISRVVPPAATRPRPKLLDGLGGTVATLGDNVYESGTASEFTNCYDPDLGPPQEPAPARPPATTST